MHWHFPFISSKSRLFRFLAFSCISGEYFPIRELFFSIKFLSSFRSVEALILSIRAKNSSVLSLVISPFLIRRISFSSKMCINDVFMVRIRLPEKNSFSGSFIRSVAASSACSSSLNLLLIYLLALKTISQTLQHNQKIG